MAAVRNGVKLHRWGFGNMPAIKMQTNVDIRNGVAYVQALQRENDTD
ncbi:hypothetical protein [uncultured Limimaricola sp.]